MIVNRRAFAASSGLSTHQTHSLAISGDREMYCGWLPVRSPPPGGGRVRGFWLEQADADQPAVVIDALDDVSVQFELGYDGGRERDPGGVQLGERDRLVASLAEVLQQPLLLGVSGRHRWIVAPSGIVGGSSVLSRAAVTGRLATGRWVAADRCVAPQPSRARWGRGYWRGEGAGLDAEAEVGRVAGALSRRRGGQAVKV